MVSLDLARPEYWICLLLGLLLLVPQVQVGPRRLTLLLLNLGFIWFALGRECVAAALLIGGAIHITGRLAGSSIDTGRRAWLILPAVLVLGLFFWHKGPTLGSAHLLTGTWDLKVILAGLGFSFVALRAVELIWASALGQIAGCNLADTFNYLFPFNMLVAGPILEWSAYREGQGLAAALDVAQALTALERIVQGLFKKFVLAKALSVLFLTGFRAPWGYQLFEVQVNYLYVFLDFSGCADIAVGTGRLLGIPTPENFREPLAARNLIDFWERWHLSLSTFIRRMVFLPVNLAILRRTGGRGAAAAGAFSVFVSFVLCALWHRIGFAFLLWGLLHTVGVLACAWYRQRITLRLGHTGMTDYLANPWINWAGRILTYEYVALSLAIVAHPALGGT